MKRLFVVATVLFSSLFLPAVSHAQKAEIAGRNCKRLGAIRTVGSSSYVCASSGKNSKKWLYVGPVASTKAPSTPLGSFNNPVPLGTSVTYGNKINITVHGYDINVMDYICESNMFNDGCDSYSRSPDPYSAYRWIRVDLTLQNVSTGLIDVFWEYSWAIVANGRFYGEYDSPAGVEEIGDIEFLPGSTVNTSAFLLVPKGIGTTNLMFVFRQTSAAWSYFRL